MLLNKSHYNIKSNNSWFLKPNKVPRYLAKTGFGCPKTDFGCPTKVKINKTVYLLVIKIGKNSMRDVKLHMKNHKI